MPNGCKTTNPQKKINLENNIQLCFNSGFGALIRAHDDKDYRNAVISIHNGVELLMKYYLREKDKLLIFQDVEFQCLIYKRKDTIKPVKLKNGKAKTITFDECIDILKYFAKLPEAYSEYLKKLNNQRNYCVHYQYWYIENELRKLLISNIYEFICKLIIEMKLNINYFILQDHIT